MDASGFNALSARVAALERSVADMQAAIGQSTAPAKTPAPNPIPASPTPNPPVSARPARRGGKFDNAESALGGGALLYVGMLLVALGVAFFLKVSFDNGWIGPSMRVAMGIAAGTALIVASLRLRRTRPPALVDAIVALGAAIDYLALFASGTLYHLLPLYAVGVLMIAVTAAVGALAYANNRQSLAYLGLLGGFLTPVLIGPDSVDRLLLYSYLGVLDCGLLALSELRPWRGVALLALIASAIYWLAFNADVLFVPASVQHPVGEALAVALGLYAIFLATTVVAWQHRRPLEAIQIVIVALNAGWLMLALNGLLSERHAILAITMLGVCAVHLLAGSLFRQRVQFWLAFVALTFAIPPTFFALVPTVPEAYALLGMHLTWVAEATLLVILGNRWSDGVLRAGGLAVFATVFIDVAGRYAGAPWDGRVVFNDPFLSLIALGGGILVARRAPAHAERSKSEGRLFYGLRVVADIALLWALSAQAFQIIGNVSHHSDAAGSVAVSVVWALYGAALILAGVRAKEALLRWEGLILLLVTAGKVLLFDLTAFALIFRVISALALGIVLLFIAAAYQRRAALAKGDARP